MMNEILDNAPSEDSNTFDAFVLDNNSSDEENTSEITYVSESDDNSVYEEDMFDDIYEDEQYNIDENLIQGKYLIGLPGYTRKTNEWLYLSGISVKSFYKYSFDDVLSYLADYSLCYVNNPKIHILKLDIKPDGVCNVVIKTFYIKIIQRKWRKIYNERKMKIMKLKTLHGLYMRELGQNLQIPSLYGLLTY